MKTKLHFALRTSHFALAVALLSTLDPQLSTARAQGTAFTYQGRLNDAGQPANGSYDLTFALFSVSSGVGQVGNTLTNSGTVVSNGLFTVTLDFGASAFPGADRWLEIGVRTNGGGPFGTLSPRHKLTATPYAITAGFVTGLLRASQLSGTLPSASLSGVYGNEVTLNNPANSFTGNGGGLTNVNAATLGGLGADQFWKTSGNSNTASGVLFLGTTDNTPLELKVNGQRVVRWERNASAPSFSSISPNLVSGHESNTVAAGIRGATIAGGGGANWYGATAPQTVNGDFSAIGGGVGNVVLGGVSTIAGGERGFIGTNAYDAFVGGGAQNSIEAADGTIGGGRLNSIQPNANDAFLGGGSDNSIQTYANYSFLGGGYGNSIQTNANNSFLGGGYYNSIQPFAVFSVLGGGDGNTIQNSSYYAFLGGGFANLILASQAMIGGGNNNTIRMFADGSVIGGGSYNLIQSNASGAIIVGGYANNNGAINTVMGGGVLNLIQPGAAQSVIGGGSQNVVQSNASHSTIPGGYGNIVGGSNSFAAGTYAQANHDGAFVWSDASASTGFSSTSSNQFSVRASGGVRFVTAGAGIIVDGQTITPQLTANDPSHSNIVNVINGSSANFVSNGVYGATIAGGGDSFYQGTHDPNAVTADFGTVGGGLQNTSSGVGATVGGGGANTSSGFESTVGGGQLQTCSGDWAVIAGGYFSSASGRASTVAGGQLQTCSGDSAAIAGGYNNSASGTGSTVAGGFFNTAAGRFSFAAGHQAQANHDGAFVWADAQNASFASTSSNQFLIRASGGVAINTDDPAGAALNVAGTVKATAFQGDGSGLFNVSSGALGNYLFGYDNVAQTVAARNVFQDIILNNDAQLNGWTHAPGAAQYTNAQTGLYLIQYSAEVTTTSANGTNATLRATVNSLEIPGSRAALTLSALSQFVPVSRSFLASFNASDVLTLQFTGSGTGIRLLGTPAVSLTVTRIQ